MSDYISRDEAVKRIDEALSRIFVVPVGESILSKLPAADVAEVVRCKNCRFCVKDGTFEGMWCRGERVSPEYYCAGGKREEKKDKQDNDGARVIADVLKSQHELWKNAINELCVREANEKRIKDGKEPSDMVEVVRCRDCKHWNKKEVSGEYPDKIKCMCGTRRTNMIDEEKLKKHVEEKCYEIKHRQAIYLSRRKDLLADFEKYKEDIVGDALISDRAILSRDAHITYENLKFETKQLCYALGAEFVEIYNRIVGDGEK